MTRPRLSDIEARTDAATDGPWSATYGDREPARVWAGPLDAEPLAVLGGYVEDSDARADAEFIAHARTDMPRLLDEVARLREAAHVASRLAALNADLDLLVEVAASGIPADVLRHVLRAYMLGASARPAPAWDEEARIDAAREVTENTHVWTFTDGYLHPGDGRFQGCSCGEAMSKDEHGAHVARATLAVVRDHQPVKPDRETVARRLYDHWRRDSVELGPWEAATEHLRGVFYGKADAVLDLWPGESRATVQAEALRDAADEYEARLPDGTGNGRAYNSYTVAAMLRARADRLAAEGGADRG